MEAGVDVIIEKPFAVSIKAGKKIIETAERNNCIVATAEQVRRGVRWSKKAVLVKDVLEGKIGGESGCTTAFKGYQQEINQHWGL